MRGSASITCATALACSVLLSPAELRAQHLEAPESEAQREGTPPSSAEAKTASAPTVSIVPPEVIEQSTPVYPKAAKEQGLQASVWLTLSIDMEGNVAEAEIVEPQGHGFDEAAVAAALKLRFSPALKNGTPVAARIRYRYDFELEEPEPIQHAQLAGRIVSGESGQPLRDALVQIEQPSAPARPSSRSLRTDADGSFHWAELPAGPITVTVSAPGHSSQQLHLTLTAGEQSDLQLALTPDQPTAPAIEVQVLGKRRERSITRRKISRRELTRVAGNRGDTLAALENMPGVARPPALSGLLIVRGTSPASTQVFVDGTFVPNMYHFGGLTSVVPSEMLEQVNFYTGNFSTRFGRGMGGIVDIELRKPQSTQQYRGLAQVDLLDARMQIEGPLPFAPGYQLQLGLRRSHVDTWLIPLLESQNTSFEAAPVYYDYQAFLTKASPGNNLRIGIFGSDDRLQLTNTASASGGFSQSVAFWNVQVLHDMLLGKDTRLHSVASFGFYSEDITVNTLRSDTEAFPMVLRSELSTPLWQGATLHTGVDLLYAPLFLDYAVPEDQGPGTPQAGSFLLRPPRVLKEGSAFFRPGAFAELELHPVRGLELTPGLRLDYSDDTDSWDLAPRVTARYLLFSGPRPTTLKAGYGFFYEPPQIQETLPGYGSAGLSSSHARQASLGIEQQLSDQASVSLEGFHIDLNRLVTRRPNREGRSEYQNLASGSVVGAELMLRYEPDAHFFGWLSYTLSRSRRTWGPGEPESFFGFDQTHVLAAVGSYRIGAGWELGARLRGVTGNPYTPCIAGLYSSYDSSYLCVNGDFQSARAHAFFQLDLRLEKRWQLSERSSLHAYLEVINATARQGEDDRAYSFDYSQSTLVSQNLPLLPNLGIVGEFE